MQLSFAQKLLVAVGMLIVLLMAALTVATDIRLRSTTDRYVDALMADAVEQSTSSISDWLNTRLDMAEATASALETIRTDNMARTLMEAMTRGGNIKDVYAGTEDGWMLMRSPEVEATLPRDYDPRTRPWHQGTVLFYPDSEVLGNNISDIIGQRPALDGSQHQFDMDGARWSVSFHPIADARAVEWYLVTFVSEDLINAPIGAGAPPEQRDVQHCFG